jgi:ribosomal protein S12 methylthiotransferase accessory factor
VHLTPAAQERLGGPAWFDRAGADARVGPLYALYREPGGTSSGALQRRAAA